MTASLYEYAKKHMSKHSRVYSAFQLDIGAGAFKSAFVTHRNVVTTAVKKTSRTNEGDERERENVEGKPRKKRDVVPPQQLLQKQGDEGRSSILLQTKGKRADGL